LHDLSIPDVTFEGYREDGIIWMEADKLVDALIIIENIFNHFLLASIQ
jgi:hypothetical protein